MLTQTTPFVVVQRDATPPARRAVRAISEHLAWRYGLALVDDDNGLLLLDGARGARVDPTDNDAPRSWQAQPFDRKHLDWHNLPTMSIRR